MWAGRTLIDANPAKDGEIFHSIADPAAPCYRGFWLACARGCRGHEGGAVLQGAVLLVPRLHTWAALCRMASTPLSCRVRLAPLPSRKPAPSRK